MKSLIFILGLFIASCNNYTPPFKYGDRVKVIAGFYEGLEGRVVDTAGYSCKVDGVSTKTTARLDIWVLCGDLEKLTNLK